MADLFATSGRGMSRRLQSALDALSPADRDIAIRAFEEVAETSPNFGSLYTAVALELRLCQMRADEDLRQLREMFKDTQDGV